MATHSSIPAWRIPWTEEPREEGYSPWGHKELDMTEATNTYNCEASTINYIIYFHSVVQSLPIFPKLFHHTKQKLLIKQEFSILLCPWPLRISNLFSVSEFAYYCYFV